MRQPDGGEKSYRPAAVAGLFYPAYPTQLRTTVSRMFEQAAGAPVEQRKRPKALIVPHAGYRYSGPIAASAYAALKQPGEAPIQRVVLIGPAHRTAVSGIATTSASGFETPMGVVPVDQEATQSLHDLPFVHERDDAHRPEHCLEVQLPFLWQALDGESGGRTAPFSVVPLLVGETTHEQVAQVLDRLWDGPGTLVVVSSDLSHYMDYETACHVDRETAKAIERGEPWVLNLDRACGYTAIQGLMATATKRGLHAHAVDLRNSGDTAGTKYEVVGYGGFHFA